MVATAGGKDLIEDARVLDKRMSPADIVGRLRDGMTIGIGGWATRRKPMALVREILRSPLRDLTVVSYGGPDVGLLCAAGKIRRLIFGFVSLDVLPLDAHFRAARQAGAIECTEYDEGMVLLGLRAAGMRLPFLPTRSGLATDVLRVNPALRTIRSPYEDGEELLAVPAIKLDAALLHVTEADAARQLRDPEPGSVLRRPLRARRARVLPELRAAAADRRDLQPRESALQPLRAQRRHRRRARAVRRAPDREHARATASTSTHLKEYSEATGDAWPAYRAKYVDLTDHAAYIAAVGGAARIDAIPAPVF